MSFLVHNFHDARLSLIQSAINHVVFHGGVAQPGMSASNPRMQMVGQHLQQLREGLSLPSGAADTIEDCLKLIVEYAWAFITDDKTKQEQIAEQYKFSPCDPGWLEAVADYIGYYWIAGKKPQYYDASSGRQLVYTLPAPAGPELVIGLLGDWGTGEQVAQVAIDQLFQRKPDLILHVGDIYYAGTLEETQQNFLVQVQAARQRYKLQIPVFNIPGNHDYYSGGEGFYQMIGQLNAGIGNGQYVQGASFFSLQGDGWQLQAMDTGYNDSDLFDVSNDITFLNSSEAAWHVQQIEDGVHAGRRVILFSHHQLFSAFENIGATSTGNQGGANYNPNLQGNFGDLIAAGKVSAWFWGHEHLFELYGKYQNLAVGRCIGYSAFPVLATGNAYQVQYPQVPANTSVVLGTTEDVYNHGYAVLKLGSSSATVEYYSIPGDATLASSSPSTLLFSETF